MWPVSWTASGQIGQEAIINSLTPYLIVGICLVFGAGCSGGNRTSENSEGPVEESKEPNKDEVKRVIESGRLTLSAVGIDGKQTWKVVGKSARAGIAESGGNEFFVTGVSGELFENGTLASTFTSDEAKAVTETKQLVLNGKVTVTSLGLQSKAHLGAGLGDGKVSLRADKITWMEDKQLFAAIGNVRIDSNDYEMGTMNEVWATPTLSKIGSPSKFK